MNTAAIASEIASRIPEMAKDSVINNANVIQGMLDEALATAKSERKKVTGQLKDDINEAMRNAWFDGKEGFPFTNLDGEESFPKP